MLGSIGKISNTSITPETNTGKKPKINMESTVNEIKDQLTKLVADISSLKDLNEKVNQVDSKLTDIQTSIATSSNLAIDVDTLKENYDELQAENKLLRTHLSILTEKVLDLEYHQKRNNLVFDGLVDTQCESSYESYHKLCDLLAPYVDVNNMKIARCHRLGTYKSGYNRPIIANFMWYGDVTSILSIKTNLPKGVYVKEDIPKIWEDRNRVLKPYSVAAKQKVCHHMLVKGS